MQPTIPKHRIVLGVGRGHQLLVGLTRRPSAPPATDQPSLRIPRHTDHQQRINELITGYAEGRTLELMPIIDHPEAAKRRSA